MSGLRGFCKPSAWHSSPTLGVEKGLSSNTRSPVASHLYHHHLCHPLFIMLSSVLLAGATVASFATLTAAQNNTSEAECHPTVQNLQQGIVTFNATGSAPMKSASFQDWHISIGMDYILARNTSIVRDVHSLGNQYMLLSLPESVVETMKEEGDGPQICYYQMDPRNATAEADDDGEIPRGSCDGILSEECQEELRNAPMPDNDGCPRIDIGDVCGGPMRLWSCRCYLDPQLRSRRGLREYHKKHSQR